MKNDTKQRVISNSEVGNDMDRFMVCCIQFEGNNIRIYTGADTPDRIWIGGFINSRLHMGHKKILGEGIKMPLINFNRRNLMPRKEVVKEAIMTGIFAAIVYFLFNFFGITLDVSKGIEVFIIVLLAVWIKNLIDIRI